MLEAQYGGPLAAYKYMEQEEDYDSKDEAAINKCHKKVFEEFLAVLYLKNTNQKKYGSILTGLNTQQTLHNDQYPKTVIDANNVLSNHRFDNAQSQSRKFGKERENRNDKSTMSEKHNKGSPSIICPARRSVLHLWQERAQVSGLSE